MILRVDEFLIYKSHDKGDYLWVLSAHDVLPKYKKTVKHWNI